MSTSPRSFLETQKTHTHTESVAKTKDEYFPFTIDRTIAVQIGILLRPRMASRYRFERFSSLNTSSGGASVFLQGFVSFEYVGSDTSSDQPGIGSFSET